MRDPIADNEAPGPEYELIMPFVVVTSVGGPYDDDAYVAGFEMGRLDAVLQLSSRATITHQVIMRTANVAQADLIAMNHRWTVAQVVELDDGWSQIELNRLDRRTR